MRDDRLRGRLRISGFSAKWSNTAPLAAKLRRADRGGPLAVTLWLSIRQFLTQIYRMAWERSKQFACWFTHSVKNGSELRRIVHSARTPQEVVENVDRFFAEKSPTGGTPAHEPSQREHRPEAGPNVGRIAVRLPLRVRGPRRGRGHSFEEANCQRKFCAAAEPRFARGSTSQSPEPGDPDSCAEPRAAPRRAGFLKPRGKSCTSASP